MIQPTYNGTNRIKNQLPLEEDELLNRAQTDDSPSKQSDGSKNQRKRRIRNVTLSLNIGLGGVGVQTVSQLKKVNDELDTKQFMSYLGLDTDSASQSGSSKGVALRDGEYVQLSTSRIRNVVDNPKSHRDACHTLGLDDPKEMAFVERLCNDRIEHAGQVRKYDLLAYLSNCLAIRATLKKKISDLTSNLQMLQRHLDHRAKIRIKGKLVVNVVYSLVGGTGSSLVLPVTSLVRELTKDLDVEIRGFGFMASCFDGKQDGKADNALRIHGNEFMSLTEINAAQTGVLAREHIRIGNDAQDQVLVPATLFHRFYVAGRDRADGRTMDSLDAVIDATVLELLALTSSEIADRADADEANTSTSNFTTHRESGHLRYVRSFGALALALPVIRLAKYCAAKQLVQVLRKNVLGPSAKPEVVAEQTQSWMNNPLEDPKLRLHESELASSLARACLPNSATVARPLYAAVSGNNRAYHRMASSPGMR